MRRSITAHACCDGRQEAAGEIIGGAGDDAEDDDEEEEPGVRVGELRDPEGEEGGVGGCSSAAIQAYSGRHGYLDGPLAGDEGEGGGGGGCQAREGEEEGGEAEVILIVH